MQYDKLELQFNWDAYYQGAFNEKLYLLSGVPFRSASPELRIHSFTQLLNYFQPLTNFHFWRHFHSKQTVLFQFKKNTSILGLETKHWSLASLQYRRQCRCLKSRPSTDMQTCIHRQFIFCGTMHRVSANEWWCHFNIDVCSVCTVTRICVPRALNVKEEQSGWETIFHHHRSSCTNYWCKFIQAQSEADST